jgi:hypothetical protein
MKKRDLQLTMVVGAVVLLAMLATQEYHISSAVLAGGTPLKALLYSRGVIWLGALGTLAIYSFLFFDNPFYKLFEHAMLGCATGLAVAVVLQDVLLSMWWTPMVASLGGAWHSGLFAGVIPGIILLLAGVLGLLWYFQFSKKWMWLSRIPLAVGLGAGAGLAIKSTFNTFVPQITTTFKSLNPEPYLVRNASGVLSISTVGDRVGLGVQNAVFVVGTVSVLIYFFFVVSRKHLAVRAPAQLGRWYLMLMLGAFFGNTFMTRLSALIERVQFLLIEWLRVIAR